MQRQARGQAAGPGSERDFASVVSVIIPTYNRLSFLPEALGSVLSQVGMGVGSLRAHEIIVIDDGSTDGTAEYLHEVETASSGGIRVVTLEHGGFPGRTRNAGVAAARSDLVAFLDVDDVWRPEKLLRQLPMHLGSAAGGAGDGPSRSGPAPGRVVLSHTRETWLRGARTISQAGQNHAREGDVFADALHKCTIGPSTTVMSRTVFEELGGFREDLEVAEDYELWLRLTHRHPVAYLDEELTIKRAGHGDQLSERYGAIEYFRIQALRDLVEADAFGNVAVHARAAAETLARKCRIYAQGCAKRGRFEEAAEYRALAQSYE